MTDDDPTDELAKKIFAAARQRRPSEAARAATLAAMLGTEEEPSRASLPSRAPRKRLRFAWALLPAAAVVVLVVFALRNKAFTAPQISADDGRWWRPSEMKPIETPSAAEPIVLPPASSEPPASVPRKFVRPRPDQPAELEKPPEVRPPPSLAEEVAALDRVRAALRANDTALALRLLDDEGVVRGTRLKAEATLLRVEALSRSGQRDTAAELARRFIDANPGSPLAEGARAFIGNASTQATGADAGGRVDSMKWGHGHGGKQEE